MHTNTSEDNIVEINKLGKNIKDKHRTLNRSILETEELLEKQLKTYCGSLKKNS